MPEVTFQEAQLIPSVWKTHPRLTSPWRPRNGVQLFATLTSEKAAPCSALAKVAGVIPVSTGWLPLRAGQRAVRGAPGWGGGQRENRAWVKFNGMLGTLLSMLSTSPSWAVFLRFCQGELHCADQRESNMGRTYGCVVFVPVVGAPSLWPRMEGQSLQLMTEAV